MLPARLVVIACALATVTACSESPVSPTPFTQPRNLSATNVTSATCSGGLFADTSRSSTVDYSGTLGLMRLRAVEVDVAAVRRSADAKAPLTLNVFPGVCLVAQVTDVTYDEDGRLIWTGVIADAGEGATVTLVTAGDVVIGSVVAGPALYQVRYAGNGVHVVMQINPAGYPPD